jgi:hypothetical protein
MDTLGVHRSQQWLALVTLAATVAGCHTEYVVDARVLAAAQKEAQSGNSVAVPVERMDGAPVYVRYEKLDLAGAQAMGPAHVVVSAPARRGHRVAGPILLSLGLTALVGGIGVVAGDLGSPCPRYGDCWRGLLAAVIGAPVGVVGIGLTIPGAILTYQGYRDPSEVVPSQRDLLYLSR